MPASTCTERTAKALTSYKAHTAVHFYLHQRCAAIAAHATPNLHHHGMHALPVTRVASMLHLSLCRPLAPSQKTRQRCRQRGRLPSEGVPARLEHSALCSMQHGTSLHKRGSTPVWGARSSGPRSRKCPQVALVAAAPFLTAFLIGALLMKASSLGSGVEELVQRGTFRRGEEAGGQGGCQGSNCTGTHAAVDAAATAATGTGSTGGAAAAAEGGWDAAASGGGDSASKGSGSGGQAGQLPPIFLFIGILSGRGYRHRRLAVREAWANEAQAPGQVVAKFVLSENERTPQVGGPLAGPVLCCIMSSCPCSRLISVC